MLSASSFCVDVSFLILVLLFIFQFCFLAILVSMRLSNRQTGLIAIAEGRYII